MPEKELLEELRLQFAREIEVKARLDKKASSIITMAGTVATLFMGFGGFLLRELSIDNPWLLGFGSVILMTEVIIVGWGIKLAVDAYKTRSYTYPMTHNAFFKNGIYDEETIKKFTKDRTEIEFYEHMIEQYLNSIKSNHEVNESKVSLINSAQRMYLIGLALIPAFVLVIIVSKFLS